MDGLELKVNNNKAAAIGNAVRIGKRIKEQIPEVADSIREGLSLSKIVERFEIDLKYQVNSVVAQRAVSYAAWGYEGGAFGERYHGLIGEDETRELQAERKRMQGKKYAREKIGTHSMSVRKRKAIG